MRLSTKIFILIFLLTLIPSVVLSVYFFRSFALVGGSIFVSLNPLGISAIVLGSLASVFGIILFVRFLRTLRLGSVLFFMILPLSLLYGGGIYFLSVIPNSEGGSVQLVAKTLKLSSASSTNTLLWALLISLVYAIAIFFIFYFACRPVQRVEKITYRLGDGRVREESFSIGKSKQFKNIEASLEKINYNYKEKENLVRQTDLEAQKFIPKEFLKFLGKNSITELELGNQIQKHATTLFCDIVSSTKLSSTLSLEENFNFINSYLNVVSPIIRKHGGFVDKYMGDGILAVFSKPERAIECSTAIYRAIEVKNRSQKALPNVEVKISIHTGEVMFGIVGEEERKSPTIISDVVNLASKMEDINHLLGTKVIFSKDSLNEVPTDYEFDYRYVGSVMVDGVENTSLFESLMVYPRKKRDRLIHLKNTFEEGVRAYLDGKYFKAKGNFKEVLKYVSDDKASYVYFNKACDKADKD